MHRPSRLLTTQVNLRGPPVGTKTKEKAAQKSTLGVSTQQERQSSLGGFKFLGQDNQAETSDDADQEGLDFNKVVFAGVGALVLGLAALASSNGIAISPQDIVAAIETFFQDPTASLEGVVATVESMGPTGVLYFGVVYTALEVLAIPAFPLTASAGYLFGLAQGTSVVLVSASIAATVSFVIGRTVLRSYVENLLEDYPDFKKIDRAIGKEGFKLMLLLRLSPIFPFAASNYLYGASSVRFWPYFLGTMIGFTPGTVAYVYSGEVGKALTIGDGSAQPWYIYLGGFALLSGFLKLLADTATGIIEDLDEDE
jgi:uncharacterized membrane protein YdjX (TVP38/TMEM64 family)